MIPFALKMTIARAMKENPKLKQEYDNNPEVREWLDMAMKLEGLPRQSSTHAAGVVISKDPITEYAPLSRNKKDESITTQYTMNNISDPGPFEDGFSGASDVDGDPGYCRDGEGKPGYCTGHAASAHGRPEGI